MTKLPPSYAKIHNRRYLGNKFALSEFIHKIVRENCSNINTVVDIFSGTGAVANLFQDKIIITNDILYSNYISHCAWFLPQDYDELKITEIINEFNHIHTSENNYMRENFSDTYFSADNCSKIGYIREYIENIYQEGDINFKEYAILITALLYGMDKIANTVGHYDAYRRVAEKERNLIIPIILPKKNNNPKNQCFNQDANILIEKIECDLLYLDPPYNSRQYSNAYHLLENIAHWQKPEVFGVARKMNRSHIKSNYCTVQATKAFEDLIQKAKIRYILLSYNNMATKGNERSNAKISDDDIINILSRKGKVTIFEQEYKSFSTGKSNIQDNIERIFLCEVFHDKNKNQGFIASPLNYQGGKFKLLKQIQPLLPKTECFVDLFTGGANVGINSKSNHIILNDINKNLIDILNMIKKTPTDELLFKIKKTIKQYNLSDTASFGYDKYDCNSQKGLSIYNKEPFLKLRGDYNKSKDILLLYVLVVFAFNNQIRFNQKGNFNLPVGKRDFNEKMQNKLILFSQKIKSNNIHLSNVDFRKFNISNLPKDTLIYCDPPYFITTATYNENGGWSEQDERDLLQFLDNIHILGLKFALSNVIATKNKQNDILKEWLDTRNYICHYLNKSYANSNYQRKEKNSQSIEVLITNYVNNED